MTRATRRSATGSLPRLDGGEVRVLDGPDRGLRADIGATPIAIGSSSRCQLVLTDPKVSRLHLEVSLARYGFVLRDLGSTNGTIFEGARVGEVAVPPGALVRLGDTTLVRGAESERGRPEPSAATEFGALVGRSTAMRKAFARLERAARSDATVLLCGETGTGKELAARAIHAAGGRATGSFEVLDCAAVAPTLLRSELFGHLRGSFTGARQDRPGVFTRAQRGTVFIDEIGELPLELQPALLRACDHGEITPLGGQPTTVDVRLIVATRRDLAQEVLAGRFREDLY